MKQIVTHLRLLIPLNEKLHPVMQDDDHMQVIRLKWIGHREQRVIISAGNFESHLEWGLSRNTI